MLNFSWYNLRAYFAPELRRLQPEQYRYSVEEVSRGFEKLSYYGQVTGKGISSVAKMGVQFQNPDGSGWYRGSARSSGGARGSL